MIIAVDCVSLGVYARMLCRINVTKTLEVRIKVMKMDCMSHFFFTWQDKSNIHKYFSRGVYDLFDLCESKN
jgi:hypothetical protein